MKELYEIIKNSIEFANSGLPTWIVGGVALVISFFAYRALKKKYKEMVAKYNREKKEDDQSEGGQDNSDASNNWEDAIDELEENLNESDKPKRPTRNQ